jgi:hypothetical protein
VRSLAGHPLATSGAAPQIVSAFRRVRRSTSTDAFQTYNPGRAGVQLASEAVHRTAPADQLRRIKRERVPTVRRTAERVRSNHFPRCILKI